MDSRAAISLTWRLLAAGIGVAIIGGWLAAAQWPGEETRIESSSVGRTTTEETVDTGNGVLAGAGLILVGAGQLLLTVSVISFGVRLGRDSSPARS